MGRSPPNSMPAPRVLAETSSAGNATNIITAATVTNWQQHNITRCQSSLNVSQQSAQLQLCACVSVVWELMCWTKQSFNICDELLIVVLVVDCWRLHTDCLQSVLILHTYTHTHTNTNTGFYQVATKQKTAPTHTSPNLTCTLTMERGFS